MSSLSRRSLRLGARALGLHAALLVMPAYAQPHADAGVQRRAASPAETPPEHSPANGVSTLKRLTNPAQLSEGVRARLEQRAARHAANLGNESEAAAAARNARQAAATGELAAPTPEGVPNDEPLRRGEALQRRVLAVDDGDGVTVLSNRLVLPDQRLMLTAQRANRAELEPSEPAEPAEELALAESASVTETRSLRALASRPTQAKAVSTGIGWLIWPFALFVLGGAVVGALWFRRKTE
jgi:hypothetical protein